MKLKIKEMKFLAGRPVCIINYKTAEEMSLHVGERILLTKGHRYLISIVDTSQNLILPGEIGVSDDIVKRLTVRTGEKVKIAVTSPPESLQYIRKKLDGKELSKFEIDSIIQDISLNALAEFEIAFFVSGTYTKKMTLREFLIHMIY